MIAPRPLLMLGLALPLLAAPVAAYAQPSPPPAPSPAAADHVEDHVQKRIDGLHRRLKITPSQEAAFQAFASQMMANAAAMKQAYEARRMDASSLTAPQNLTTYADLADAHAKEARSMVAPFKALYAQLAPEQQQIADTIFREQAEHMGRHRHG